ncbi:MAG: ATP--cobalamin adenosyltransferase [Ignavibacteria bacterium]|nr:ATP--cobalamin adenosyltransferase [Ignavibacteria bacterium]
MKIYTKTGDDGTTGLFDGSRTKKSSLRVETYGTVDELNSALGLSISFEMDEELKKDLSVISNFLFTMGSDLATPSNKPRKIERISNQQINFLEERIDSYTNELPPLRNFILPGGCHSASLLHLCRTICRRAERLAVKLNESEPITPEVLIVLNRLSDYFFTATRLSNLRAGVEEFIRK